MKKLPVRVSIAILVLFAAVVAVGEWAYLRVTSTPAPATNAVISPSSEDAESEAPIPKAVPVTTTEAQKMPADHTALGGYNVLIADRGNNRLIEVTPDKKIVWEYDYHLPAPGLGADDAFFINGGKQIVAGLEEWQTIEIIDYATKKITWQYGVPGHPGSAPGLLHTPDDPYMLPNGDVIVADISNCRVIEISPDKKIVRQYGSTGHCGNAPGELDKPNGDTPIADGHILISNIQGHSLVELDQDWKPVFTMTFPLQYPSDPQMMKNGHILIAGYTNPGKIMEVAKDGTVVWKMDDTSGPNSLKLPSLAKELPNGNIIATDDAHDRVVVIDKATHNIIWQYGVTNKPGRGPGQLNTPDGVDFVMRNGTEPALKEVTTEPIDGTVHTVGEVSRHPDGYVGKAVIMRGYMLRSEGSGIIISDEPTGTVGRYDLPVVGQGTSVVQPGKLYEFAGTFVSGTVSSNGNPYRLELSRPPEEVTTK